MSTNAKKESLKSVFQCIDDITAWFEEHAADSDVEEVLQKAREGAAAIAVAKKRLAVVANEVKKVTVLLGEDEKEEKKFD